MSIDDKCQDRKVIERAKIPYCGNTAKICEFRADYLFRYYDVNRYPKMQMLYRCLKREK